MRLPLAIAALSIAAAPAPPIEVRSADFLLELAAPDGMHSYSTTQIPYLPDQACFHWVLRVKPEARTIKIHERLTLPAPAAQWTYDPDGKTAITKDQRSAESDLDVALGDGVIGNVWCVAVGDPQGRYTIDVSVGGAPLHHFDFTVGKPSP